MCLFANIQKGVMRSIDWMCLKCTCGCGWGTADIPHGCLVRRFNDEYDLNYFEYSALVFVYRYAIVNQLTWARAFHSCHRFGKRRSESNTSPVQRERHVVCVENNVRRMLWKYKHNIQLRAAECCIIYIDVQAAGTFLVTLHNYTGRQLKAVNGSCNSATPQAHVSFILTLFFVKFLQVKTKIARKKIRFDWELRTTFKISFS